MDYLGIGLSVLALLWLAFREIAPKTSWKWDDELVNFVDGVANQMGVQPKDLIAKGKQKPKMGKK